MSIMFLFVLAVILAWVVYAVCQQLLAGDETKTQYDERQENIRCKGYQYAAYTGIIMSVITGLIYSFATNLAVDAGLMMIINAFAPVLVYVLYCIIQGIYFGVSGKWRRWFWTMLIIGGLNVWIGIQRIHDYGFLQNGKLTLRNHSNLLVGIVILIPAITALIVQLVNKKNDAE